MSKFKVGDKVRVKARHDIREELRGKVVNIIGGQCARGDYQLDISVGGSHPRSFQDRKMGERVAGARG